jgi:hypothetical protein
LIGNLYRYLKHFFYNPLYRKYKINYLQARKRNMKVLFATKTLSLLTSLQTGVKTMESAQLILTYLFDIVFYGFSTLFIFDFLWGLNALIERLHQAQKEVLPVPAIVSKASKKNAQMQPTTETQAEKLTFNQVCVEFAEKGLALERYRSGHYCYRVVFGCESPPRFKRLQDALDWLAASTTKKSQSEAENLTTSCGVKLC